MRSDFQSQVYPAPDCARCSASQAEAGGSPCCASSWQSTSLEGKCREPLGERPTALGPATPCAVLGDGHALRRAGDAVLRTAARDAWGSLAGGRDSVRAVLASAVFRLLGGYVTGASTPR